MTALSAYIICLEAITYTDSCKWMHYHGNPRSDVHRFLIQYILVVHEASMPR